jgi:hypothetical protein
MRKNNKAALGAIAEEILANVECKRLSDLEQAKPVALLR